MTKYHINKKGIPTICKAEKGSCPFGDNNHFPSFKEAKNHINELEEETHGLLPEFKDNSVDSSLPKKWENKFLSYKYFADFVEDCGEEIMDDELFDENDDPYEKSLAIWKDLHYKNSEKAIRKISDEEAVDLVRENMNMSDITGWFRAFDSDYKPKIERALITQPELRNAGLNIAHRVYQENSGNKVDFDDFLDMEIEVYRGGNFDFIENDVFISYSFDKNVAQKFANDIKGSPVKSHKVKMRDTLGSLQTDGEVELMVRNKIK